MPQTPVLKRMPTNARSNFFDRPAPPGGGPVQVYIALEVIKLSSIDCVAATAQVQFDAYLFWQDPRVAELHEQAQQAQTNTKRRLSAAISTRHVNPMSPMIEEVYEIDHLPADLWRPSFDLCQRCADIPQELFCSYSFNENSDEADIVDPKTGLMQLCISVTGTIDNFMDVHNFPYDEDSVDITLCGCFLRDGRPADATDFVLIPSDPRIVDTGYPFLALCFLTDLPAYEILGYNFKAYTKSKRHKKNAAYTRTWSYLNWGISIRRKSSWYFWKVNLLLYLIAVFSLATFVFSPEDFDARTQHTSTLFLASAATLYVVGEKLPPISFLTKCDKLIVATLGLIFLAQVECCIVKFMVDDGQVRFDMFP